MNLKKPPFGLMSPITRKLLLSFAGWPTQMQESLKCLWPQNLKMTTKKYRGAKELVAGAYAFLSLFFWKFMIWKNAEKDTLPTIYLCISPWILYICSFFLHWVCFVPWSIDTLQSLQEQRQQHLLRCGSRVSGASRQSGNSGLLAATRSWEMRRGLISSRLKRWRTWKVVNPNYPWGYSSFTDCILHICIRYMAVVLRSVSWCILHNYLFTIVYCIHL